MRIAKWQNIRLNKILIVFLYANKKQSKMKLINDSIHNITKINKMHRNKF